MVRFLNECLTYTGYTVTLHAPFMATSAPVILSIYPAGDSDNKLAELSVSDQLYIVNLKLMSTNIRSTELFLLIYRCILDLKGDNLLPRTAIITVRLPVSSGVLLPEEWAKSLGFTVVHSCNAFRTYRLVVKPTLLARCKYLMRKLK